MKELILTAIPKFIILLFIGIEIFAYCYGIYLVIDLISLTKIDAPTTKDLSKMIYDGIMILWIYSYVTRTTEENA